MPKRRIGRDMVWLRVAIACAVCFVSAGLALAQSASAPAASGKVSAKGQRNAPKPDEIPAAASIRIQSNLVTAPVSVIDKKTGQFVYDLMPNDFEILDNGRPQEIANFDRESHRIAAVILVQNSRSVTPLLSDIKQVAPIFSQLMLGSKGEAAVITFGSNVQVAQGFSNSGSELDSTLRRILPSGTKARLNDALMQAINLLQHRPKGERRVIVAFTTGYDSGSETSKNEIIRRATSAEVEIYSLALSLTKAYLKTDKQPMNLPTTPENANVTMPPHPGTPNSPSSSMATFGVTVPVTDAIGPAVRGVESKVLSNDAEAYANYTGALFYSQWSAKALQSNLSQIATDIHSQYLLAYVPDDLSQTGFHRLEVKVKRPGMKLDIRTRRGYFYEGGQ
jgi:VWFA-related protein